MTSIDSFLVSIIVPAFNAEKYIAQTLDSVLAQTHQAIEVVVVNDGSTDRTTEIATSYEDPRIRIVEQENQGQSAAINRGVEMSHGEFIKIVDADDCLNADHIHAQLLALQGNDGSELCLASCQWGYFVDDPLKANYREEKTNCSYSDPFQWIMDSLTRDEGMMGGWMWLIPRAVWNRSGGYDERLSLNNDYHFSINLLLSSKGVRYADEAKYAYRKGLSDALSASRGARAMESAYLTTRLGTERLLERSSSARTRKICADRYQWWLFQFYPDHMALVRKTEERIKELGGSRLKMDGGRLAHLLQPLIGWKGVRQMQRIGYKLGWQTVLKFKANRRVQALRH